MKTGGPIIALIKDSLSQAQMDGHTLRGLPLQMRWCVKSMFIALKIPSTAVTQCFKPVWVKIIKYENSALQVSIP